MTVALQTAANHLAGHDGVLAPIIISSPLPSFVRHTNYYQELVESIIGQQLSVKAAATIQRRFDALFDTTAPTPQHILTKTVDEMRNVGLSRQKAGYIQDLAQKVINGTIRFDHLDALSNQAVIDELTQIKGVGEWTVHMLLIFCMGRLDVLPTGDLGIRNGIGRLYDFHDTPTPTDVISIATTNHWHPYESVASWYIWQSLDTTPQTIKSPLTG